MNVPAQARQIYEEHLRGHRNSTRQQRWQNLLDRAKVETAADHRGLQEAFEQLEREYSASLQIVSSGCP